MAARDDLDAWIHLGDYTYEYANPGAGETYGEYRINDPVNEIRPLSDYRRRYACYRADADLQELHRLHPVIHVWDDHEFADDPFIGGASNHQAEDGDWNLRVAAALQAYSEWMPTRLDGRCVTAIWRRSSGWTANAVSSGPSPTTAICTWDGHSSTGSTANSVRSPATGPSWLSSRRLQQLRPIVVRVDGANVIEVACSPVRPPRARSGGPDRRHPPFPCHRRARRSRRLRSRRFRRNRCGRVRCRINLVTGFERVGFRIPGPMDLGRQAGIPGGRFDSRAGSERLLRLPGPGETPRSAAGRTLAQRLHESTRCTRPPTRTISGDRLRVHRLAGSRPPSDHVPHDRTS